MKKFANILMLSLTILLFTASCGSDAPINVNEPGNVRSGQANEQQGMNEFQTITFKGQEIKFDVSDIMVASASQNAAQTAADANSILNSFTAAAKEEQTLEVSFAMDDKPVDNGVFVFGIETEDAKNLTMEMYDEEGFGVAKNQFEIVQGNNYKALNVNALSSGSYTFRLKDDSGKELQKQIVINND